MKYQYKTKNKKSRSLKWKLFGWFVAITAILLVVLWIFQTIFLGVFYRSVKTEELKRKTSVSWIL